MSERVYRSVKDCKVAGVCGGLGEYFNTDPTLVRILFILFTIFHGIGLIAYIIGWIAMPKRPAEMVSEIKTEPTAEMNAALPPAKPYRSDLFIGLALITVGAILVLWHIYWWLDMGYIMAIIFVIIGLILIFRFGGHNKTTNSNIQPGGELK
jgi:phage shock protein C